MKKTTTSEEDDLQQVVGSFDCLDAVRTEQLDTSNRLQNISNQALVRERARLANKYGADHPRVKKLDARLSYNQQMLKGLATTIERNNINVQPFPSKSWRVHGRVFDPNDLPLKGLTVFLAGSNKQAIPGLAYACSDEQGYYAITLSEREITELKLETVYLAVSDANRKIVYFNAEPLHVLLRTIDYRDIFIEAEVCGAPPPDSIEPPVTIAHPKFVVAMDKNNQYYFHLTTTNGEILIKSKAYKDQESAVSGVQSLKQNVARERFEIQISRGKKYYFTIKSPDGIIIFTSELYDSDIVLTKVIESVISIAPGAPVELIS